MRALFNKTLLLALLTLPALSWAQEDVKLLEVEVTRERSLMIPNGLYANSEALPPHIGNVFQLDIFKDQLSQEVWYTQTPCLQVEQQSQIQPGDESGMILKWNKLRNDCEVDWIGLGIGWNGWAAKDLFGIVDSAAIRLRVRATNGKINSLPLAMALEDYADKQAWIGVTPDRFQTVPISEDWGDVILPLNAFDWNLQNANLSNIKQLIIQFEADGELIVDKIDLVRKPVPPRHRTKLFVVRDSLVLDGKADEAILQKPSFEMPFGVAAWLYANAKYMGVYLELPEHDSLKNLSKVELFVSSNPNASAKRGARLMSDHWISNDLRGNIRSESMGMDLKKSQSRMLKVGDMHSLEWLIQLNEAHMAGFEEGEELLFDLKLSFSNGSSEWVRVWNNQLHQGDDLPKNWGFVDIVAANP